MEDLLWKHFTHRSLKDNLAFLYDIKYYDAENIKDYLDSKSTIRFPAYKQFFVSKIKQDLAAIYLYNLGFSIEKVTEFVARLRLSDNSGEFETYFLDSTRFLVERGKLLNSMLDDPEYAGLGMMDGSYPLSTPVSAKHREIVQRFDKESLGEMPRQIARIRHTLSFKEFKEEFKLKDRAGLIQIVHSFDDGNAYVIGIEKKIYLRGNHKKKAESPGNLTPLRVW